MSVRTFRPMLQGASVPSAAYAEVCTIQVVKECHDILVATYIDHLSFAWTYCKEVARSRAVN